MMVLSFVGVTINKHYCGENLYSFKIYNYHKSCCGNNQCGHCKNETVLIKLQNDFIPSVQQEINNVKIPIQLFGLKEMFPSDKLADNSAANIHCFKDISPPETSADLPVLQTFLL